LLELGSKVPTPAALEGSSLGTWREPVDHGSALSGFQEQEAHDRPLDRAHERLGPRGAAGEQGGQEEERGG